MQYYLTALGILAVMSVSQNGALGTHIEEVYTEPAHPVWPEPITPVTTGWEGYITTQFDEFELNRLDNLFVWDLFFSGPDIGLPVAWDWSFTTPVGNLPPDTYSIQVRTFRNYDQFPFPVDSLSTSFNVIPEPATLLLFAVAATAMARRPRRRFKRPPL